MKPKRVLVFCGAGACLWAANSAISNNEGVILAYSAKVFPLIIYRLSAVFGCLPFSIGDVFYTCLLIGLCAGLVKYYNNFRQNKIVRYGLFCKLCRLALGLFIGYCGFQGLWGYNYYKPPLRQAWGLDTAASPPFRLVEYHRFLVTQLNALAPQYKAMGVEEANYIASHSYSTYTTLPHPLQTLHTKPSLFSFFLMRLDVGGYYNPFTGEAQVDNNLPRFLLPFTIVHEMAHQAGIAAEGDANLTAYTLSTASNNATFRYSAYFNLYLYTYSRLKHKNPTLARQYEASLNPLTRAHIDTLRMLSKQVDNPVAHFAANLYDTYLKMQQQEQGIGSYKGVVTDAWLWEKVKYRYANHKLHLP